jgi:hypothetical protein
MGAIRPESFGALGVYSFTADRWYWNWGRRRADGRSWWRAANPNSHSALRSGREVGSWRAAFRLRPAYQRYERAATTAQSRFPGMGSGDVIAGKQITQKSSRHIALHSLNDCSRDNINASLHDTLSGFSQLMAGSSYCNRIKLGIGLNSHSVTAVAAPRSGRRRPARCNAHARLAAESAAGRHATAGNQSSNMASACPVR